MKVHTLKNEDFIKSCLNLSKQANQEPDLVVSILNGGSHVVEAMKASGNFENTEVLGVKMQRKLSSKKESTIIKFILSVLPYICLNWFREIESKWMRKSIKSIRKDQLMGQKEVVNYAGEKDSIKTILIVDDAIDTGKTMFVVKNNLKKVFPNANIEVAVVSWTITDSIVKPDYYIFKEVLIRFPWSRDFKINRV